jgi:hypothetical protein
VGLRPLLAELRPARTAAPAVAAPLQLAPPPRQRQLRHPDQHPSASTEQPGGFTHLARILHQCPGGWRGTGAAGRRPGARVIAVAMTCVKAGPGVPRPDRAPIGRGLLAHCIPRKRLDPRRIDRRLQ